MSEVPKQRGIFSEILTTEDAENLKVLPNQLTSPLASLHHRAFLGERHPGEHQAEDAPRPR